MSGQEKLGSRAAERVSEGVAHGNKQLDDLIRQHQLQVAQLQEAAASQRQQQMTQLQERLDKRQEKEARYMEDALNSRRQNYV